MNTHCRLSGDLVAARTCYRHLAGALGISIVAALEKRGYLKISRKPESVKYMLTDCGKEWSQKLGIGSRDRVQINACMDYSHQIPHISGAWSIDFCKFLFSQKYIIRGDIDRSAIVTPSGNSFFQAELAMEWMP